MPADDPSQLPPGAALNTDDASNDEALQRPLGLLAGGGGMVGAGGTTAAPLPIHGWRRIVSALHYPNYRLLWAGALVSNIGSWMQNIACDWLVYQLSGKEFWLGLNAFVEGIAVLLLLPIGGVLADRVDRRNLLVISNFISAALAAGLAALAATGKLQAWHIVAFSAGNGAMNAMRIPSVQSLLPTLVGRHDLGNAVALNSMQFNLSRTIGPMLGGITLWTLGPAWSFGLNAASFIAVIGALLLVRDLPAIAPRRESVWRSLRGGVAYVRGRADLMAMLVLVIVGGMLAAPVMKMLPALVHDVYGRDATDYSLLLSCFGIGAIFGALLLAARSNRGPTPWRAMPLMAVLGGLQIAASFPMHFGLLMLIMGVCGMTFIGANVRLNTAVLHSTPDHVRGRVSSLHMMALSTGMPVGSLIAGWIAQTAGVAAAFWIHGGLLIIVMPLAMLAIHRSDVSYQHAAGGIASHPIPDSADNAE